MSDQLCDFLSSQSSNIIEETVAAIKGLKTTRYDDSSPEELRDTISGFFADGLIFLRTDEVIPLITNVLSYGKKKIEQGFQMYEPLLAFLTVKDVILDQLWKTFAIKNNDLDLYHQSETKINHLFKILMVNVVEVLNHEIANSKFVPKIQRYPVWLGKGKNSRKNLED